MNKLEKLTQQEQDFIYEVIRKFITISTMGEAAQRVGICRIIAFNWDKAAAYLRLSDRELIKQEYRKKRGLI